MQDHPQVIVNGTSYSQRGTANHANLLDWLRSIGLTSVKEGCAEGECGACAVLVARSDGEDSSRWTSVNACLPPAVAFDGQEVLTAEGLGSAGNPITEPQLHPVQREMAERGGSQCGYCTPGFVCSMAAEYYRPERCSQPAAQADDQDATHTTDDHEVGPNGFDLHSLSGNLCRCTGYRPIRDAAYALGSPEENDPLKSRLDTAAPSNVATVSAGPESEFRRPATFEELLTWYAEQPDAVLLAGATDLGVETNIRHSRPPLVLAIDHLPQLRGLQSTSAHIEIGAALTLSEIERRLDGEIPLLSQLLPQFASRLIRNSATLGGNLGTASPIGDAAPALLALNASLVLTSAEGERTVALADYFTGYRQSVRAVGELIRAVRIPKPLASSTAFYKVAKRRFDDISSVAVAFAMEVEDGEISEVSIGLGGVAATPTRAEATEQALLGRQWNLETVAQAAEVMGVEGTPMDDHRASSSYRAAMLEQSLPRFFAQTTAAQSKEDRS